MLLINLFSQKLIIKVLYNSEKLKIIKLTKLLIGLIGIYLMCAYAQGRSVDTLELELATVTGTEKIDALIELSESYVNQQPERSIEFASESLELSLSSNDSKRQGLSLFQLAYAYRVQGDNIKALDYFFQSLTIFQQLEDKLNIARSLNQIGKLYRFMGNYSDAMDSHIGALRIYEELRNKPGIAASLINAGIVYRNLGNKEQALLNYNQALEISRDMNDYTNVVNALLSIGNIHWYDNENEKALAFFEEALEISRQEDFTGDHPAGILNNIGNVYRSLGDFSKALEYYQQSLGITREVGDKNLIAVTIKNIGITYQESGRFSQAIQYLSESKDMAKQIHLLNVQREALDHLSQTYTALADYKKALEYFIEFSKLKDSLFDEETSDKMSIMQLGYDIREQEQEKTITEIDLLLETSKERNLRYIIIFISIVAILLVIILWYRFRLKIKSNLELRELNVDLERRVEERTIRLREENEKRKKIQEQAELANETKNRFLATISHEVRTPINAIIGFCDLAINPDVHDDHQTNLRRVKDSSEHLLALIKDVIDYAQIESGKMELKKYKFDICNLIESVVNAYYLDASSKQIKLSHEIGSNIPKFVIGDSDALRQILYNLIGNAIKFTDKGSVDIKVELEEQNLKTNNVKLKFTVKDTGIGITKLKQKLIFTDFTQGNGTISSRRYGGVGLGLTICKYFVELMNGKILVKSEKDKGSEFEFVINLEVDKEETTKKVIKKEPVKRKLKILVAEDNLLNSQVVTSFLKRLGHTSDIASNGKVALEKLAAKDYDVVLMDIEMPEMDGFEATKEIRNGNYQIKNPNIPIIALTAHALRDYEEKSYEAGMDSYLTKPIDIDRLSEALQSI